jgi:Holliday junction resolvase
VNKSKARGTGWEVRLVNRARKRELEARRQPGSGAYKGIPNDVVVEGWLGEAKMRTDHPSMAQMMEWLRGVEANAEEHGFAGAFLAYNHKGSRKPVVMIDLEAFLGLLREVRLANM